MLWPRSIAPEVAIIPVSSSNKMFEFSDQIYNFYLKGIEVLIDERSLCRS